MGMIGRLLSRRLFVSGGMLLATALSVRGGAVRAAAAAPPWRWAIDYGAQPDPDLARQYDLLVLEPDQGHALDRLRSGRNALIGYVSLGEIEKNRPYAAAMATAGVTSTRNPHWPDARYADLRLPAWRDALIGEILPAILARGYDGFFFDTLDNAEAMERADPAGAKGMVDAAAQLVQDIRAAFPDAILVMNRGYALLPRVAPAIDYLLAEAMATRWNFTEKQYERLSASDVEWQASRLNAARAANPRLTALTLDYWDQADRATVAQLYAARRREGFCPYVSTLALDRLWPEPRG